MAYTPPPTAPFQPDGSLSSYPGFRDPEAPNEPFDATLRITGIERGHSAARFVAENVDTGAKYPIFMTDLLAIITQEGIAAGGTVTGRWQAGKRGANYGLRLIGASA